MMTQIIVLPISAEITYTDVYTDGDDVCIDDDDSGDDVDDGDHEIFMLYLEPITKAAKYN